MIKVSILYQNRHGGQFDMDYYVNTHMPISIHMLGAALRGVTVEHGVSGMERESEPAYVAMCHLFFDSVEAFLSAFTPHAEWIRNDIANYTNIEPMIQYSEVKIHQ